jgi:hypothetical protein
MPSVAYIPMGLPFVWLPLSVKVTSFHAGHYKFDYEAVFQGADGER